MITHLHYERNRSAQDIVRSRLLRVKSLLWWLIQFQSNYFWYSCMYSHTLCKRWCFVMPSHLLKQVVTTMRWNWLMPGFNALSPSAVTLNIRKLALQNMAETRTFLECIFIQKSFKKYLLKIKTVAKTTRQFGYLVCHDTLAGLPRNAVSPRQRAVPERVSFLF